MSPESRTTPFAGRLGHAVPSPLIGPLHLQLQDHAAAPVSGSRQKMMRPAASRAPEYTQKRYRSFARHVNKAGEEYKTIMRTDPLLSQKPAISHKFFKVSNLLFDLDAEDAKGVRPFGHEDELRMDRWAVNPKRAAIAARLKEFEEQIHASRRMSLRILSRPANIWRITHHDILSAALQGAPAGPRKAQREQVESGGVHGRSYILQQVRIENGIPPHAAEDDEQLLRWMLLRRRTCDRIERIREGKALTGSQMAGALLVQTSIMGIRRLVFQCLAAGTTTAGFMKTSAFKSALPSRIRQACERVLGQSSRDPASVLETLVFIGNLSGRMTPPSRHVGAPLCGLGLKLAAEAGVLEAASEWLYRGHENDIWTDLKTSEDVLSTLNSFRSMLTDERAAGFHHVQNRLFLFQMLTGIDQDGVLAPDSLRAVVVLYLGANCKLVGQKAFEIYASYVRLLGQLGAARMLWKEWRVSAHQAQMRLKKQPAIGEKVASIFQQALGHLVHATAASDGKPQSEDTSLDTCATLDHHVIGMRDANIGPSAPGALSNHLSVEDATSALELPLEEWMHVVRELRPRADAPAVTIT